MDQNLLKLELELGIILINFWLVSSFNQGNNRKMFKLKNFPINDDIYPHRLQRNDNKLKVNSANLKDWMKGLKYFPKKLSQKKKKVMNLHV